MNIGFKNKIYSINRFTISDIHICFVTENGTLLNVYFDSEIGNGKESIVINKQLQEQAHSFYDKVEATLLENPNYVNSLYFDIEREIPILEAKLKTIDTANPKDLVDEHNFKIHFSKIHKNKKYQYALIVRNEYTQQKSLNEKHIFFLDDSTIGKDIVLYKNTTHIYRHEVFNDGGEIVDYDDYYPIQLGEDKIAKNIQEAISLLRKNKVHLSYMGVFNRKQSQRVLIVFLSIFGFIALIGMLIPFFN